MKTNLFGLVMVFLLLVSSTALAEDEKLIFTGTPVGKYVLNALAKAYMKDNPQTKVIIRMEGFGDAFKAVNEGKADGIMLWYNSFKRFNPMEKENFEFIIYCIQYREADGEIYFTEHLGLVVKKPPNKKLKRFISFVNSSAAGKVIKELEGNYIPVHN